MFSQLQRAIPYHTLVKRPSHEIGRIQISNQERIAKRLTAKNMRRSLTEFHRNGLVILEDAIDQEALDRLHSRMLHDFRDYRTSAAVRWNQGRNAGNISQPLPPLPEFLDESIWANRLGVDTMQHIIGPKPALSLATSNIALPETHGRQAVHSDYYCVHHNFPVFLEVNAYLQDVESTNGATEFWLGTHHDYGKEDHSSPKTGWIKKEVFDHRATVSPPIQPSVRRGSLLIRDLRLWHAGRANHSKTPRIVLGFLFSPQWFGSHMRMKFPYSARSKLEAWDHIECLGNVDFVEEDFNYLDSNQDINLTQSGSETYPKIIAQNAINQVVTPKDYWEPT